MKSNGVFRVHCFDFYEPNCIATIDRLLRRTLVRFVILSTLFNRKEHKEDAEDRKGFASLCECLSVLCGSSLATFTIGFNHSFFA